MVTKGWLKGLLLPARRLLQCCLAATGEQEMLSSRLLARLDQVCAGQRLSLKPGSVDRSGLCACAKGFSSLALPPSCSLPPLLPSLHHCSSTGDACRTEALCQTLPLAGTSLPCFRCLPSLLPLQLHSETAWGRCVIVSARQLQPCHHSGRGHPGLTSQLLSAGLDALLPSLPT